MPINLNDPRVRKTRRSLQDALVRLILKKGYDAISIHDIVDEADTARITFYRHYHDKQELLAECLDRLYEDLAERIERVTYEGFVGGRSPVTVLYAHIEEHEALYRLLFSSHGAPTVLERIRHIIAKHAQLAIQAFVGDNQTSIPIEILAHYAASAQFGLAMWWLDNNRPYPIAYMGQVSVVLTLSGLASAIGQLRHNLPIPQPPRP